MPRALIGQEVVGQPGGLRVAKSTLSHKDGTAWQEPGMRSLENFERLQLRIQLCIPVLAPAPTSSIMSRRLRLLLQFREKWPNSVGSGSGPKYLDSGNFRTTPAPTPDPAPIRIFRRLQLQLRAKSSGLGWFRLRIQIGIASQEILGRQEDAERPKWH